MGNYYEGKLTFILKKDTKKEILNDLESLMKTESITSDYENYDISGFSDKLKKTDFFKHERWSWPRYELSKIYYNPEGFTLYDKYVFTDYYESEDDLDFIEGLEICNYRFSVNFCMKMYRYNRMDLGKIICNFLKPYIDLTAYDMSDGGYLGKIKDEDCTYDKSFFIDTEVYKKTIKEREFLCKGCDRYIEDSLCEHYKFCKRAYDLGTKENI